MRPLLLASLFLVPVLSAQSATPLRVLLRGGPKTHGEGQHDHPRFVAEWQPLLEKRGCTVSGTMEFPSAEQLAQSDVLVIYAADGAAIHGDERARLESFLGRGGGLVVLHDGVCGDDPLWFQTVAGGAWEHGHSQYFEGEIGLCFADHEHPITQGAGNFDFQDEIYWDLHLDPKAHVLANAFHTPFDVTPQMWTYEKDAYRAFVSIQGHEWKSFANPAWRTLLLRGIAWAGKRDADLLVTQAEVAGLRYPPGGPLAPEKAAAALVLHPDFELSLVAAEPLVVNPISLDWDARGRMWVALTPSYPDKQQFSGVPARDQVVILADANGDGRMDERKVFAEGLDLVTSLVFQRDGVIVAQAPEILWLRDTDGDDKADQRVVLYQGFGFGDTHAVVSNLRWGRDGWIYATQGYSGNASEHVVGRDGVDHGKIGNGLFRFRPDGSAIEMVSAYGSNTWGLDFTWDEELVFTMANGSHSRHVVLSEAELARGRVGGVESWLQVNDHERAFPLRDHERPPYQQIDFVGGFTAAAGCCVYTGGAWPAEFDGDEFVCEPTINLVHHDSLTEKGVSFVASKAREAEFLASTDLWFRPVHLRVGPDGALYVLDFYNQAAVHNDTRGPQHGPTNAAVRADRDHEHGRIWRIQHRRAKPAAVPALAQADELQLVTALEHANGWVRSTAQRLLCEREKLAAPTQMALQEKALASYAPAGRIAALWTLARVAPERLLSVSSSAQQDMLAGVRKNALRALGTLDDFAVTRGLSQPERVFDERDARTRLAGLVLLRRVMPEAAYPRLIELTLALEEDWSRSAVLAIAARRPASFAEAALASPGAERLEPLLRALGKNLAQRKDMGQAIEVVVTMAERGTRAPGPAVAVLDELARGLAAADKPWPSPRLDNALIRLLASPFPEVTIAALPLAQRWSDSSKVVDARAALGGRLAEIVGDEGRAQGLRLGALTTMLALPEHEARALELAGGFLDPLYPLDVQTRVIDALGALPAAASTLCARFGALSQPARERALAVLLARPAATHVLLDALDAGELRANELGPQGLHRLRNHPDATVAARATELLQRLVGGERSDKDALLAELTPLVDRPGDAARGRELFEKNCGNCHTAKGAETRGDVGPDLTGMGAHGARELLPFLIDPNRAVEPAFLEYVVETNGGELIDGVIKRETAEALLIRNANGEREVRRTDIAELRSTGRSPMPTGFESLGADALRDVIAFLAGEWAGFRVVDLRLYCSSSTARGLYDTQKDAKPMLFKQYGVTGVEGVPFEVLDPARMSEQKNTLTLRGGMGAGWESHSYPQKVEIPLGYSFARLFVLGGIAAWGYPYTQSKSPAVKLTWKYVDGTSAEQLLLDGTEFGDWIGRNDVPGSQWVDVLSEDSWGQMRMFALVPEKSGVVSSIVLESFDNHLAPTFVALTAQLAGASPLPAPNSAPRPSPQVLVFGGGSSHDFRRWYEKEDGATLATTQKSVGYSEDPAELARALAELEVLVLCTNQPLADPALREAVFAFSARGGGLVLAHPATWYNWADWPEYNRELVGGGAKSHEAYAEFGVRLTAEHALTQGVPKSFSVKDELYRLELDLDVDGAAGSTVLAIGKSQTSGAEFPVLWTRGHGKGRIVGLTLGHDGAAHESEAYRRLLRNAVAWVCAAK
ncbi:MAG: c-type cytochrome [Planctomycetes bacterium]|nr:c-type cytochrome [Planctomycetota bacterium]